MESNQPNELSARVKFTDVVTRLEKMSNTQNLDRKRTILNNFFDGIVELQQKFRDENGPEANASFYPFLRLFLPNYDLERGAYGIKDKKLGQLFVKALAINAKSDTANKLTNLQGNTTDYGDIVFEVMKSRSPENGTLTVYEVNKYLDLIAEHFKHNERRKIDEEIVQMFRGMSALDRKWLTRILLKKLNLGLGQKSILGKYHPKAWDLYNQYSHLSRVCEIIESNVPLDEIKGGIIEVFKPIRPMLCERGYISQINQMLKDHVYYLETKMDGERCQLHISGTEFKYFSRSCLEDGLTKIFGENSTTGLYSPWLYHHLKGKVRDVIFDGEIMVWDTVNETYLKKAENYTAKHLKKEDQRLRPCYCIYDLIYVNGESLICKPYAERIRKLNTIVREQKGSLMLCERIKVIDANHFLECLNKAFDSNEEGVVIKQEDSKYRPGQREKGGWFKMKPDYENSLISDFDLLIIGGFYNDNRTAIDSFLLAVFKKNSVDSDAGVFHSVCKIRNGLSRSNFAEILTKLDRFRHEIKNRRHECPSEIEWANANPDFWFEPKNSIVLQIKASELTETTTYRTSHTFRFPRVMAIRWDKMWYDTCTLSEFQTFCASGSKVVKITKRHATSNDLTSDTTVPKRQRGAAAKTLPSMASTSNNIETVDNICEGLEFHIVNGAKDLENMVSKHSGKVVAYPNSKTFVIIAPNPKSINVEKFIRDKQHNIATKQWLIRALGSDKPLTELIKFTPDDMVYATEELQKEFDAELDKDDDIETPPMNFENSTPPVDRMDMNNESTAEDNEPNGEEDLVGIVDVGRAQIASNEVTLDDIQPNACKEIDEEMNEAITDDKAVEKPVVSTNEPNEVEQDDVQVNDSVYECDTQLIEPVIHKELVPDVVQADIVFNETNEIIESREDDNCDEKKMFGSCVAYFYQENSDWNVTYAQCMLMGSGGTCLETAEEIQESTSRLTHIFVANADFDHARFKQTIESFGIKQLKDILIMRCQWILDCDEQKKRICDRSYRIEL